MAIQVELVVSFHMGLPSMMQGVETDTDVPQNLQDDDFDEDSAELPLGRPLTEYTAMTYPIHKTKILRVFGQIARQAHALTPPSYPEVLKLDTLLQETWRSIPSFLHARPLDRSTARRVYMRTVISSHPAFRNRGSIQQVSLRLTPTLPGRSDSPSRA